MTQNSAQNRRARRLVQYKRHEMYTSWHSAFGIVPVTTVPPASEFCDRKNTRHASSSPAVQNSVSIVRCQSVNLSEQEPKTAQSDVGTSSVVSICGWYRCGSRGASDSQLTCAEHQRRKAGRLSVEVGPVLRIWPYKHVYRPIGMMYPTQRR